MMRRTTGSSSTTRILGRSLFAMSFTLEVTASSIDDWSDGCLIMPPKWLEKSTSTDVGNWPPSTQLATYLAPKWATVNVYFEAVVVEEWTAGVTGVRIASRVYLQLAFHSVQLIMPLSAAA